MNKQSMLIRWRSTRESLTSTSHSLARFIRRLRWALAMVWQGEASARTQLARSAGESSVSQAIPSSNQVTSAALCDLVYLLYQQNRKVTHYTFVEGGVWHVFEGGFPFSFHALRFDTGTEWDAISGIRPKGSRDWEWELIYEDRDIRKSRNN